MTPPPIMPQSNKRMKPTQVAVVTHYFGGHGGGIEQVAERLIREITLDQNYQFTWAASDSDPTPIIDGQRMLPMRSFNFIEKILGVPWPLWRFKSLSKLKNAIKKADVVWLHDTLYLGNLMAYRWARKSNKPVMITQHISSIDYKNPILRVLMKIADKLFTQRMLSNAQEVTFSSDRVAEHYYQKVAFTRAIRVIPTGVDTRTFSIPLPEKRRFLRQQFALKNDQPVMLFIGRFIERKGIEVIKLLAEKIPYWRFWIVGYGPTDPEKWMLPNVHVFKDRKGQKLAELYQAADLFLLPSHGEGFPLVLQEAMACGLPILCGKETAQGSAPAMPYLHIADVFSNDPQRTAAVWHNKLKKFPIALPLSTPLEDTAEFAYMNWSWHPIANVYADILKKLHMENS